MLATLVLLGVAGGGTASAANCGGAVQCNCGDRVVTDTVLTADIGPCSWGSNSTELVGLRIDSGVTLDCNQHAIIGPADARKEEFGVKFGTASRPVDGATLRNCDISGFWWGIHLVASTNIIIENNSIHDNGWMDPTANGTGYGIDITGLDLEPTEHVIVRGNSVHNNGNEGIHLSSSSGVQLVDNLVEGNGKEQIYILRADRNLIRDNVTRGGTQGLELRDSNDNTFSRNRWKESPLHLLETDSDGNLFEYDDFEGKLRVGPGCSDNTFRYTRLDNPTGTCADVDGDGTLFRQAWFGDCSLVVDASLPAIVDRTVGLPPGRVRSPLVVVYKGCNADLDGDGVVSAADAVAVAAAAGSVPGSAEWNPAADLDHDRIVDASDQAIVAWQSGRCLTANARPKPQMKVLVLQNAPLGQPDVIKLIAERSGDRDGRVVRHHIMVRDWLTGALINEANLVGASPLDAFLQATYPPGRYVATLTVTDNYWEPSRMIKRGFRVR